LPSIKDGVKTLKGKTLNQIKFLLFKRITKYSLVFTLWWKLSILLFLVLVKFSISILGLSLRLLAKVQKVPKCSRRFQKVPIAFGMFQKALKDFRKLQKVPKCSNVFQKTLESSIMF